MPHSILFFRKLKAGLQVHLAHVNVESRSKFIKMYKQKSYKSLYESQGEFKLFGDKGTVLHVQN